MNELPKVIGLYIEGLKAHDVARIADTVSDDLEFISIKQTLNKTQFLDMLRALYAAFPDWTYGHDPPESRDDCIAIKWRQGGTHTVALVMPGLNPTEATGRTVNIPEQYFFYKVRDGLITEIRPDPIPGGAPAGILEQIGIEPPL